MKFATVAAAAALALTGISSAAIAAPTVGATVTGPEGNAVGTVVSVADGVVVVDTGAHKAPLPLDAFGEGETGPTITVTKAQIVGMVEQQMAAAATARDAKLTAGAMVHTADDAMLGTVESVEGDDVIVEREAGPVALTRNQFAVDANGTLIVLFTAAEIEAAASGAAAEAE